MREAAHGLFQQNDGVEVEEAGRILHVLQQRAQNRKPDSLAFCFFGKLKKTRSFLSNLLQGGLTQLDGDVREEAVPLRAEISDDVGVRVRLPKQLHLPLGHLETLGQDPLDGDAASVKFPPEVDGNRRKQFLWFHCQEQRHTEAS